MIFDRFDVVVVPFPFTDREASLRRPALVLSSTAFAEGAGHYVLAMITRAARSDWPHDVAIGDLQAAGLDVPCRVRMKLFTIDGRLILKRAGRIGEADRRSVSAGLQALFES